MVNNRGQSTIEFMLTMIFSFGFLITFVQFSLNSGLGYLMHYTLFMASRSYLVFDDNNNNARLTDARAKSFVLNNVLYKSGLTELGMSEESINNNLQVNSPEDYIQAGKNWIYMGLAMSEKRRFTSFPLIGGSREVILTSESFLGREPTRSTCWLRLCQYVMNDHIGFNCNPAVQNKHITLFDNGC